MSVLANPKRCFVQESEEETANIRNGNVALSLYPRAKQIRLVQDNLNTHDGASLYETYAPAEARRILVKLDFHYTPKHGSWLAEMAAVTPAYTRPMHPKGLPNQ